MKASSNSDHVFLRQDSRLISTNQIQAFVDQRINERLSSVKVKVANNSRNITAISEKVNELEVQQRCLLENLQKLTEQLKSSQALQQCSVSTEMTAQRRFSVLLANHMSCFFEEIYNVAYSKTHEREKSSIEQNVVTAASFLEELPVPFFSLAVKCGLLLLEHVCDQRAAANAKAINRVVNAQFFSDKNLFSQVAEKIASIYASHIDLLTYEGMETLASAMVAYQKNYLKKNAEVISDLLEKDQDFSSSFNVANILIFSLWLGSDSGFNTEKLACSGDSADWKSHQLLDESSFLIGLTEDKVLKIFRSNAQRSDYPDCLIERPLLDQFLFYVQKITGKKTNDLFIFTACEERMSEKRKGSLPTVLLDAKKKHVSSDDLLIVSQEKMRPYLERIKRSSKQTSLVTLIQTNKCIDLNEKEKAYLLYEAVENLSYDVANVILAKLLANPNAPVSEKKERTAFHALCRAAKKHREEARQIATLLLKHDSYCSLQDVQGKVPLDYLPVKSSYDEFRNTLSKKAVQPLDVEPLLLIKKLWQKTALESDQRTQVEKYIKRRRGDYVDLYDNYKTTQLRCEDEPRLNAKRLYAHYGKVNHYLLEDKVYFNDFPAELIARIGEVTPESVEKKPGLYFSRTQNGNVSVLIIDRDKEQEVLSVSDLTGSALFEGLSWPEHTSKTRVTLASELIAVIGRHSELANRRINAPLKVSDETLRSDEAWVSRKQGQLDQIIKKYHAEIGELQRRCDFLEGNSFERRIRVLFGSLCNYSRAYAHSLIAAKGRVSADGRRAGFYVYRDEEEAIWVLAIDHGMKHERLCLTTLARTNNTISEILRQLVWPKDNRNAATQFDEVLVDVIVANCPHLCLRIILDALSLPPDGFKQAITETFLKSLKQRLEARFSHDHCKTNNLVIRLLQEIYAQHQWSEEGDIPFLRDQKRLRDEFEYKRLTLEKTKELFPEEVDQVTEDKPALLDHYRKQLARTQESWETSSYLKKFLNEMSHFMRELAVLKQFEKETGFSLVQVRVALIEHFPKLFALPVVNKAIEEKQLNPAPETVVLADVQATTGDSARLASPVTDGLASSTATEAMRGSGTVATTPIISGSPLFSPSASSIAVCTHPSRPVDLPSPRAPLLSSGELGLPSSNRQMASASPSESAFLQEYSLFAKNALTEAQQFGSQRQARRNRLTGKATTAVSVSDNTSNYQPQ